MLEARQHVLAGDGGAAVAARDAIGADLPRPHRRRQRGGRTMSELVISDLRAGVEGKEILLGVDLHERLTEEAGASGFDVHLLERALNVELSGGEKKRNETVQLCVLRPKIAVLDEIDSGLDIDALRAVSRRIERETHEAGLGVL